MCSLHTTSVFACYFLLLHWLLELTFVSEKCYWFVAISKSLFSHFHKILIRAFSRNKDINIAIEEYKIKSFFKLVQLGKWHDVAEKFAPNALSTVFDKPFNPNALSTVSGEPYNQTVGISNSSTLIVSFMCSIFWWQMISNMPKQKGTAWSLYKIILIWLFDSQAAFNGKPCNLEGFQSNETSATMIVKVNNMVNKKN